MKPNRKTAIVTIDGRIQPSNFHFVVADFTQTISGYGARIFFHSPTNATKEILNRLSCWGGPDKDYWHDAEIKGWEFSEEGLAALKAVVLVTTGEDLSAQLIK